MSADFTGYAGPRVVVQMTEHEFGPLALQYQNQAGHQLGLKDLFPLTSSAVRLGTGYMFTDQGWVRGPVAVLPQPAAWHPATTRISVINPSHPKELSMGAVSIAQPTTYAFVVSSDVDAMRRQVKMLRTDHNGPDTTAIGQKLQNVSRILADVESAQDLLHGLRESVLRGEAVDWQIASKLLQADGGALRAVLDEEGLSTGAYAKKHFETSMRNMAAIALVSANLLLDGGHREANLYRNLYVQTAQKVDLAEVLRQGMFPWDASNDYLLQQHDEREDALRSGRAPDLSTEQPRRAAPSAAPKRAAARPQPGPTKQSAQRLHAERMAPAKSLDVDIIDATGSRPEVGAFNNRELLVQTRGEGDLGTTCLVMTEGGPALAQTGRLRVTVPGRTDAIAGYHGSPAERGPMTQLTGEHIPRLIDPAILVAHVVAIDKFDETSRATAAAFRHSVQAIVAPPAPLGPDASIYIPPAGRNGSNEANLRHRRLMQLAEGLRTKKATELLGDPHLDAAAAREVIGLLGDDLTAAGLLDSASRGDDMTTVTRHIAQTGLLAFMERHGNDGDGWSRRLDASARSLASAALHAQGEEFGFDERPSAKVLRPTLAARLADL